MSVLSEWDIINELGRKILIYPFNGKDKSIRGCCLCLTASEFAYTYIIDGQTQQKKTELLTKADKNIIQIPKKQTAVLWTNESVLLKDYFCGSIHSKVKLVSKGIGHIGTRVNPNYGGVLAIALHNFSEYDIQIEVGEVIAYLMVYRLSSKSSSSQQIDDAGKLNDAIPEGFPRPPELINWLNDLQHQWRKGDKEALGRVLEQSPEYKEAKNELKKKSIRYRFIFKYFPQWEPIIWFTALLVVVEIVQIIITPTVINWFKNSFSPISPKPTQTTIPEKKIAPTPKSDPATK